MLTKKIPTKYQKVDRKDITNSFHNMHPPFDIVTVFRGYESHALKNCAI